jgi:tetratricopeptide (TPR) repeat protein
MTQMNFVKAEKQYKSIYENSENASSQFMINLLNNYSICLLNQRKFEESASLATKIILEYDNKNKRAYLTILSILCNIKEYKKAEELIEKMNTIFKKPKDFELFKGIINDINNALNEEEDNKQRNVYYNREKKIIDLVNNKWIHFGMYSLGTFIGACLLYKFISK